MARIKIPKTLRPNQRALQDALLAGFQRLASAERAEPMRAYMKSEMPFWGLSKPVLKKVCRDVFKAHPLETEAQFESSVLSLWRSAKHREERYAAIELSGTKAYAAFQTLARLPMYEELIVRGAWWDFVDEVAIHRVGPLRDQHPKVVTKLLREWAEHDDMWLRRTSIIAQVASKAATDTKLLGFAIKKNWSDKEFFIRKAIGWALRQHAYIDADWVQAFVDEHAEKLSGLSKREALKNMAKLRDKKPAR